MSLEQFQGRYWVELQSPDYPNERLIACRNPQLAEERSRRRQELLQATEVELNKIVAATQREKHPLRGKDAIGVRVGKVVNRFKVAKHFHLEITDEHFSYQRQAEGIEAEARLDGIYVIRTSVATKTLSALDVVQAYKSLAHVEQAFRCFKSIDLNVRPIFHRLEDRVKAHVLLCFLAYYVEWHLRQALSPLLFEEDDPEGAQQQRASVVESAKKSPSARNKAATKRTTADLPVHSFRSLLADLATITKSTIQPTQKGLPCDHQVTKPTPVQQRVFELLKVQL